MNSESSIRFPADFSYITAEEELTIQGGTEIEAIDSIVSNITKISRVLNYLARIFAASSSMLNNLITVYNTAKQTSVYKGYKQDKIEMRGDRAEMSDFPLYLNTVAGGLDRRDQTIGGFSFVVKIYAVPVVEIIG